VGLDVATIIHYYEAILATLAIIVWHLYYVFLNPDFAPMSFTWIDGKLSRHDMEHEHALELEEIDAYERRGETPRRPTSPGSPRRRNGEDDPPLSCRGLRRRRAVVGRARRRGHPGRGRVHGLPRGQDDREDASQRKTVSLYVDLQAYRASLHGKGSCVTCHADAKAPHGN